MTRIACYCFLIACSGGQQSLADSLQAAHRLLQLADAQYHYEARTAEQTRAIIRSYASIVSMSAAVELPDELKQEISSCYANVYAWENFEDGLARILADNLTEKELLLLIDFYNDLGLPPFEIQNFRNTIAKANHIQRISQEYMWTNSASCVEHDAELILNYVATQTSI